MAMTCSDIKELTVKQLRALAKQHHVKGYSMYRKKETLADYLCKHLTHGQVTWKEVCGKQDTRSEHAKAIDEAIEAKTQYVGPDPGWMKQPDRSDIDDLDSIVHHPKCQELEKKKQK